MLRVSLGREEEFERIRGWLDASAALDAVIEATESRRPRRGPRIVRPLPAALVAAYREDRRPETVAGQHWRAARARV